MSAPRARNGPKGISEPFSLPLKTIRPMPIIEPERLPRNVVSITAFQPRKAAEHRHQLDITAAHSLLLQYLYAQKSDQIK